MHNGILQEVATLVQRVKSAYALAGFIVGFWAAIAICAWTHHD